MQWFRIRVTSANMAVNEKCLHCLWVTIGSLVIQVAFLKIVNNFKPTNSLPTYIHTHTHTSALHTAPYTKFLMKSAHGLFPKLIPFSQYSTSHHHSKTSSHYKHQLEPPKNGSNSLRIYLALMGASRPSSFSTASEYACSLHIMDT